MVRLRMITTVLLATRAPVLVAPAMNVNMWRHAATQANLARPQVGVDAAGILWVLNRDPPSLSRIDSNGILTTIAGMAAIRP